MKSEESYSAWNVRIKEHKAKRVSKINTRYTPYAAVMKGCRVYLCGMQDMSYLLGAVQSTAGRIFLDVCRYDISFWKI